MKAGQLLALVEEELGRWEDGIEPESFSPQVSTALDQLQQIRDRALELRGGR